MLVWDKDTGVTVQEDVPWSEFTRTSKEEAQEYLEQVIGDVAFEKRKTANALAAGNKPTYTMLRLQEIEELLNISCAVLKHTSGALYLRNDEFDLTVASIKSYVVPYKLIAETACISYFENDPVSDTLIENSFSRCIGSDFISILDDTVDRQHLKLTIDRKTICRCCGKLFDITYEEDLNSSEEIFLCSYCDYHSKGLTSFFDDDEG